ncbi:MAG: hypothetical protein NVS1B13_10290 [Flavisolibacter sp.]
MKKFFLLLALVFLVLNLMAAIPEPVNRKVLTAFSKTFTNAVDIHWYEYVSYYEVEFKHNDIKTKITYNLEGTIVNTIRYYSANYLPILVLTKIKNKYCDHNIFGVVEESSEEGVVYHITLEDQKYWIIVKSDDMGYLVRENKFVKG